jgi:hypothetical protein
VAQVGKQRTNHRFLIRPESAVPTQQNDVILLPDDIPFSADEQFMRYFPGGILGDAQAPGKFKTGNTALCLGHMENRPKPRFQRPLKADRRPGCRI